MENVRINKFIAEISNYSRREVDDLIKNSRVKVDGVLANLGQKISGHEKIEVNKKLLDKKKNKVLIAYNKPVGVICTTDKKSKDNIIEKIGYEDRVYPIGRLDVKTSGLILLTNDSKLKTMFEDPKFNKEKEYLVTVDRVIKNSDLKNLRNGINIGGYITKKAKVLRIGEKSAKIIITEGKNRQIKRMFDKLGFMVVKLKRTRIGNVLLGELKSGEWRKVEQSEIILDTRIKKML